jgi:hypothetical protein
MFAERTLITANDAVNTHARFFFLRAHGEAQPATALRTPRAEKNTATEYLLSAESRDSATF